MEGNTNLFWFGFLVEFIFILAIVKGVDLGSKGNDKLDAERNRLRRDYQRLQQELEQKAALTQESLRLQQELQRHKEQLNEEYLQLQQALQQKEHLNSEHAHVQQELQHMKQALQQQNEQLTRDYLQLQQEFAQQKERSTQEYHQLQQALQQQEAKLTSELRQTIFKQLQTLLTNYPSVSKLAQVKPDLPAKNLTSIFVPLESLIQTWGYKTIGSVWEQVTYDPKLHQPDAPDIEPGDLVYIRFVGYQDGDKILCPAKVSRTLSNAATAPQTPHAEV